MSCLTDSIVDPPHLHCKSTAAYQSPGYAKDKDKEEYTGVFPLHLKRLGLGTDSLFSLFSWATKDEAGDVYPREHSVDAIAHSVDPSNRRVSKRGPSPPSRGPSPPPYLALGKLAPRLARCAPCPTESDVDKGFRKVDTNIDTGRNEESLFPDAAFGASVDGDLGIAVDVVKRPKSRRLDVGDSVDRRGSVESFSHGVDAQSSITNASETSAKDWEPHEADSLLSQIYDLGDDCICLMHPCICNLDENSYPEPPANKYDGSKKARWPRKQVGEGIRQREKEILKIQQLPSSSVDQKDEEGTSTDLHYHSRSKEQERADSDVKLSSRVISKTRFSPYTHGGTNVDPGSTEEPAVITTMSNRSVLLQKDYMGHGVDSESRVSLGASVDGDVTRLSCMYSSAVDAGDTAVFAKSFSAQSSTVDDGNTGEHEHIFKGTLGDSASTVNTMYDAQPSILDVNFTAEASFQNTTVRYDAMTESFVMETTPSLEECVDNNSDINHAVAAIDQAVQVCMLTPEPIDEFASEYLYVESETPGLSDVMYDDSMGDSFERDTRQTSFPSLPQVFDTLCFGAERARSTNVDDALAEDNGSRRCDQILKQLNRERELRFSDYLPDDGVDGSFSGTEQFRDVDSYGIAVDGSPCRTSPPRRCRSDPDMQGSKTDPSPRNPASYPSLKSLSRTSRIPRRILKPGEKVSEQELPSQQEQKQQRSPKLLYRNVKPRKQFECGQQSTDNARPPSEEGHDAASMCRSQGSRESRSPVSPSTEERLLKLQEFSYRDNIRDSIRDVINTDYRSKPYVPQVITFYTHRDSKVATTIPPPILVRKTFPVKTPDLPPWNPSTLVDKSKRYSRPHPLHYKRDSSMSLLSNTSEASKHSLLKEADSMEQMYINPNDMSQSDEASTPIVQHISSPSRSPNKKPPAHPHKTPFRPAGMASDKKRPVPASNTARCHPELRVPCKNVEIPVVYPSMKATSSPSPKSVLPSSEAKTPEVNVAVDEADKPSYSPGPEKYHYPAYTAPVNETNNSVKEADPADETNSFSRASFVVDNKSTTNNDNISNDNITVDCISSNHGNDNINSNNNNHSSTTKSMITQTSSGHIIMPKSRRSNSVSRCERKYNQTLTPYTRRKLKLPGLSKDALQYLNPRSPVQSHCQRNLGTLRSPESKKQLLSVSTLLQYVPPHIHIDSTVFRQDSAHAILNTCSGKKPLAIHLPTVDLTSAEGNCWSPFVSRQTVIHLSRNCHI